MTGLEEAKIDGGKAVGARPNSEVVSSKNGVVPNADPYEDQIDTNPKNVRRSARLEDSRNVKNDMKSSEKFDLDEVRSKKSHDHAKTRSYTDQMPRVPPKKDHELKTDQELRRQVSKDVKGGSDADSEVDNMGDDGDRVNSLANADHGSGPSTGEPSPKKQVNDPHDYSFQNEGHKNP